MAGDQLGVGWWVSDLGTSFCGFDVKTSSHRGGKARRDQTEKLSWKSDDQPGFQPIPGCQDKDAAVTGD